MPEQPSPKAKATMRWSVTADDKKLGMTLDELRAFVAQADEIKAPAEAALHAVVSFTGKLQQIELRAPR